MQRLNWYLHRLRGMSAGEIAWRAASALRDAAEAGRAALRLPPSPPDLPEALPAADGPPPFRVSDIRIGEWAPGACPEPDAAWGLALARRAEQILRHRLGLPGLGDLDLGDPIEWNRDYGSGVLAPLRFAPWMDYRDFRRVGDVRVTWELNRHHHLVVLGRAYRATGEARYAAAIVEHLDSWLQQCPPGRGVNWRSPLELAIRLINWVWALDLIHEAGLCAGPFRQRLLGAVYLHLREITRRYSRHSSANNHRIGEAAGVFIATSYFRALPNADRWRAESRRILEEEILAQTHADGGSREQALGYHLFVLELLLLAAIVARHTGAPFPEGYRHRLERMLEFAGALGEGGETLPAFGDSDDGRVLDLGGSPGDPRGLLAVGAVLFGRGDFKAWAGGYPETARWLLGRQGRQAFEAIAPPPSAGALRSRAFADSGYYLLQCGRPGHRDRISVVFDCGELGFGPLAAHGHADALSITLRAFGADVLVDPGTYDYFSFPRWRAYFRSTRAHNTLTVDDRDQSAMLGPFLWGARARARCLDWSPRAAGGAVTGEHDGYAGLDPPVIHRRGVELDGGARTLTLRDEVLTRGRPEVAIHFHLSEQCEVAAVRAHRYDLSLPGGTVTLELDPRLGVTLLRGSEEPMGGWVSRGYHRKVPGTTLIARARCEGESSFVSRFAISGPR
jgi:hypothetical protein